MAIIQRVASPQEFERAFEVRRAVFIEEQRVPEALERDEFDAMATHVMAWEGDRVVGTARLALIHGVPRIGRMAVVKSHRGRGIGRDLLHALLDIAKTEHLREVHLAAQLHVEAFYGNLGFVSYGEVFEEAGILHRMMKRVLVSPTADGCPPSRERPTNADHA